jgi:hypothetical protein
MNLDIVISYLRFLSYELGYYFANLCLFLIWKNALMYVSVKIYVASQSYLEVVDFDCGSVMERNRENEISQKLSLIQG